jgi:hypothetical protein
MSNEVRFSAEEKLVLLTAFVGASYWLSLWFLGVTWWKAPIVGLLAAVVYRIGWGGPWMQHATVALLALAAAVWIEALPPPAQWKVSPGFLAVALQR